MELETVVVEVNDGLAVLRLNRPEMLNALSIELARDIRAALARVKAQPEVRALILTGAGRGFCAGAQLREAPLDATETNAQRGARIMKEHYNPMILELTSLPIPVIAAVNGVAAGAGVSIALAADIVLAAESAYFMLVFAPRLGIIPDLGATWHLPRLLGRGRAHALTLLGDRLPAKTAADWGLIWKCFPADQLMGEAFALARRLGDAPQHIVAEVRRAFDAAESNDLVAQLEYERQRQQELTNMDAFKEGVRAFLEKREPIFPRS